MKYLVILTWLFSSILLSNEKIDWKLISDENGVQIFEAENNDKPGPVYLKFNVLLSYPIDVVKTIMRDTSRKGQWVPRAAVFKIIERISPTESIEYAKYYAPWPFDDREVVLNVKISSDPLTNEFYLKMHSVKHAQVPPNDDYVRAHTYNANLLLRPVGDKTYLEFWFLTDFKGYIPNWIINITQRSWPAKLVKRLKELLKKEVIESSLNVVAKQAQNIVRMNK
ncbi:MAG: hypothetical protein ISR65_04945 [Bacteriovoracaceae bacterium]|nr:hypothetical protein [Bacteriovoracaceae bacterium]